MNKGHIKQLHIYRSVSSIVQLIADGTYLIPEISFDIAEFVLERGIIDNKMRIEEGIARPRLGPSWGFYFFEKHLTEI